MGFIAANNALAEAISLPSVSSTLALSADEQFLWVANPDANSVTKLNLQSGAIDKQIVTDQEPWSVAITQNKVLVANRQAGSLTLIDGNNTQQYPIGSEIASVVVSPDGKFAYITITGENRLAVFDINQRQVIQDILVGSQPWGLGLWRYDNGSAKLIVTHRIAKHGNNNQNPKDRQAWISLVSTDSGKVEEIDIPNYKFGFSNALESLALTEKYAFLPHLLQNPEESRSFHSTISGAITTVSLKEKLSPQARNIETNNSSFSTPVNFPRAIAVNPQQTRMYVVLAGSDLVMGINIEHSEHPRLIGFWQVGKNPRGIVLNRTGSKAYVMNYLSRDVSILDLADELHRAELNRFKTTEETLEAEVLRGKILFNKANDPRLSRLGWVSCASCHFDGGVDGTSWPSPEGLRQTKPLWELEGTAPFHISATRDEIQDFEMDIERFMGGVGLAPGVFNPLLGQPNAGTSDDLDALAKFVLTGVHAPRANQINPEILAFGRKKFSIHCAQCHGGEKWTTSHMPKSSDVSEPVNNDEATRQISNILQSVGTYNHNTDKIGKDGFDIPTLLGISSTAPYFHDGSAFTLKEVLDHPVHGGKLDDATQTSIIEFVKTIDSSTLSVKPANHQFIHKDIEP